MAKDALDRRSGNEVVLAAHHGNDIDILLTVSGRYVTTANEERGLQGKIGFNDEGLVA